MSMSILTPIPTSVIAKLRAGDRVNLSGIVYAGRQSAYSRLADAVRRGEAIPIDLERQVICCVDETIVRDGVTWGITIGNGLSLDHGASLLLTEGVRGILGTGTNSATMKYVYRKYGAVQFGPAAPISGHVEAARVVMGEGADVILALNLIDFPVVVACDAFGGENSNDEVDDM